MDNYYSELLKSHLLPPLSTMMRNTDLSVTERGRAIKNIADGSLARTGSGAGWSTALGDQLHLQQSAAPSSTNPPATAKIPQKSRQPRPRISRRIIRRPQRGVLRSIRPSRCSLKRRATTVTHRSIGTKHTIKSRVKTLQALVPGGSGMNWPVLLGEAADYMMFLRLQVGVLQSVAAAIDGQQQQQQQQQQIPS